MVYNHNTNIAAAAIKTASLTLSCAEIKTVP